MPMGWWGLDAVCMRVIVALSAIYDDKNKWMYNLIVEFNPVEFNNSL
mgnify:CR=1 FL=1|jgi:hypothetical protein